MRKFLDKGLANLSSKAPLHLFQRGTQAARRRLRRLSDQFVADKEISSPPRPRSRQRSSDCVLGDCLVAPSQSCVAMQHETGPADGTVIIYRLSFVAGTPSYLDWLTRNAHVRASNTARRIAADGKCA
jgi:hypothetical protein